MLLIISQKYPNNIVNARAKKFVIADRLSRKPLQSLLNTDNQVSCRVRYYEVSCTTHNFYNRWTFFFFLFFNPVMYYMSGRKKGNNKLRQNKKVPTLTKPVA